MQNARLTDILTTAFPVRLPEVTIEKDLIILPQGSGMDRVFQAQPFILLKCTAFTHNSMLNVIPDESGIIYHYLGRFNGYGRTAIQLYNIDPARSPIEDWLWLATLQQIAPDKWDEADLWSIDCPEEKLSSIKKTIRKNLGLEFYRVQYLNNKFRVMINPVHMPDKSRINTEWEILSSCLYS